MINYIVISPIDIFQIYFVDRIKILSKDIGDKVFIPVLTNEQVVQLVKEGKLGQKINNTKD
ncbi:hypothetical protein [Acinetobacter baumannii]|uniref:hypothetical protein n=1 Tax=Acinetobacter baumannii TaxID=470 RepID=UPI001D17727C|nr:hypothetical protein [Acinetobacter baumannii]